MIKRSLGIITRNLLGWILILAGTFLALPFVPGPGTPMIVFGLALADWPYKQRVFCWLRSKTWFRNAEHWCERKMHMRLPIPRDDPPPIISKHDL